MRGKKQFTTLEAQKIKELIERKVKAESNEQNAIRAKIRKIGFYYSEFSSKKVGYTVTDFQNLINANQITIIDDPK